MNPHHPESRILARRRIHVQRRFQEAASTCARSPKRTDSHRSAC
jgi:hypothetical protein